MRLMDHLTPLAAGLASGLVALGFVFLWKRLTKKPSGISRMDQVASYFLRHKPDVDPAKYYVVALDLDPGYFSAYLELRRTPPILEFQSREEADAYAKDASIDPVEQESWTFVFRGREEYLAIYHEGREPA
jgi:hypothetical protein